MANPKALTLLLFFYASFLLISPGTHATAGGDYSDELQTWIIQVKNPQNTSLVRLPDFMKKWYAELLDADHIRATTNGALTVDRLVHSYSHVMTGFAARLTEKELEVIKKQPWFLYAYPDVQYKLLTSHSPQFLGLPNNYWDHSNSGEGVIIGMVDGGIAQDHPSFSGAGMPPPPAKWKGRCEAPVVCNNKLIGAQSFIAGKPPLDESDSHGSHTASTAAGARVDNFSLLDVPGSWASGMAPRAHIAAYKVCFEGFCGTSDMLAAIGAAIRDGVDVISLSIGVVDWRSFGSDPLSAGTLNAVRHGVFIAVAAGNNGPGASTVVAETPWIMTVGSSSTDRVITTNVRLGDGQEIEGQSINQTMSLGPEMLPLVYAGDIPNDGAEYCHAEAFVGADVKGKVVICEFGGGMNEYPLKKAKHVLKAGGVAMILVSEPTKGFGLGNDDIPVLPVTSVSFADGKILRSYLNSAGRNATATLQSKGWVYGRRAPVVSVSSSRGPSLASEGILKPDIIAPGVNILAAITGGYGLKTGTSMSTPHIAGIAALLKHAHPDWSPSAIKSAIMTTADTTDNTGGPILDEKHQPANYFAVGAGHVNATAASDPGLVYETNEDEYIPYLCGLSFTSKQVSGILNRTIDCAKETKITEQDLNYPSISVSLGTDAAVTVHRRVTNVGEPLATYRAKIEVPAGVSAVVMPRELTFGEVREVNNFTITFTRKSGGGFGYVEGQLKWVSKRHVVRSPISIKLTE